MRTFAKSTRAFTAAAVIGGLMIIGGASGAQAANPCAPNPCATKASNPCADKKAANPCAGKKMPNPCATKNPCAPKH